MVDLEPKHGVAIAGGGIGEDDGRLQVVEDDAFFFFSCYFKQEKRLSLLSLMEKYCSNTC